MDGGLFIYGSILAFTPSYYCIREILAPDITADLVSSSGVVRPLHTG